MTIYEKVKEKLEKFPDFRERKNRSKYLAILALRNLGLEGKQKNEPLSLEQLSYFAIKFDSFRHAWGDVTRDNKHLRGSDYDDGEILSQEKQIELGYTPNYYQDNRKLKTIQ